MKFCCRRKSFLCIAVQPPSFPDLVEKVTQSIHRLGGAVLPKLNWSAPRDAMWIAPGNSLRCVCPGEVILLLKSSNFVAHDLSRVLVLPCHECLSMLDGFLWTRFEIIVRFQYCQPDPQTFKPEYMVNHQ